MNNKNYIKEYLSNQLSEEELNDITKKFNSDDQFAEEISEQIIKDFNRQQLKNHLSSIDLNKTKKFSNKRLVKLISIAASVVLAIGIPIYLMRGVNQEKLFSNYFKPYQNVITVRGENDTEIIGKAMNAYDLGSYEEAITNFEDIDEKSNQIKLYEGISYLAINKLDEAITLLSEIANSKNDFYSQANWYLALSYLKLNKLDETKKHLNVVIDQGVFNVKKAKELLQEID